MLSASAVPKSRIFGAAGIRHVQLSTPDSTISAMDADGLLWCNCRFKLAPNLRVPAGEPGLASINASHSLRAQHVRSWLVDNYQNNAAYGEFVPFSGGYRDSIWGAHQDGSMAEAMVVGPLERGSCVLPPKHGQESCQPHGCDWDPEEALLREFLIEGQDIYLACSLSTVHGGDAPTWASIDLTRAAVSDMARICKAWRGNVVGAGDHIKDDAMGITPCSVWSRGVEGTLQRMLAHSDTPPSMPPPAFGVRVRSFVRWFEGQGGRTLNGGRP
ncbi:uncharacterized protein NECHADRAFT_102064 [Fusarium vanettenii 77-13-4]|uniref:Uncharacterized protein n=1 Tax=Fusarium vanettenii (strain ATCC MYA-4622 / CBS 123669 / FGSC 9596 / NRRL 45880 / 77-13-4) TaxID=660122 RepID=C7ZMN8_FUSV7|nr:uncharacterized protein NECHADRAFT_102064 [Fusarium vanettenii 77-13-4]EEU34703.1 predicted protein [Fusarium vanettenii 77-13-4]